MSELIAKADIKRHAEAAAERDEGPSACPYVAGSDAAHYWRDCFYVACYRLSGEESA